ncbi:glycosyltransferase involved in cell wall biosynthesis [Paenibacillus endophyticus]|uniref:Glycosyltransferase involved in cell wall biosynthesis n=1 Tax=Paenibacillus endophyticus TaxID=1294268 RepID=A0A7W5C2S2_9BACL|nr:glycosyltransferase [Paenibacillus endophyticus]MBB3150050.1 glycosyltransferase involved in cell wall biosynthesis [Paenibacillus endophyticus]
MKKKILFVMNNLNCGGAEKSLLSLLQTIDLSKFDVDLYLFKHEGIFFDKLPEAVHILEEPTGYRYFDMSIRKAVYSCLKSGNVKLALSRIVAGFILSTEKNAARREQRVWKYLSVGLPALQQKYDAAIGFLEKNPVYFCIEKVQANQKIGFIHNDYDKLQMDSRIDFPFFTKLDHLVTVSDGCGEVLNQRFPQFKQKIKIIHNIISPPIIHKMSTERMDVDINAGHGISIVSIGRLTSQKGFEMAIGACKTLVEQGYDLNWYVIGEGEERIHLEKLIDSYGLDRYFHLIGLKENPYPYIQNADIYVQPSRFEGKSISIDEAKILQKPIVVTNFSTARDQIIHKQNGLIVEMNAASLSEGIKQLIDDKEMRIYLKEQLALEKLGSELEIEKLYALI